MARNPSFDEFPIKNLISYSNSSIGIWIEDTDYYIFNSFFSC